MPKRTQSSVNMKTPRWWSAMKRSLSFMGAVSSQTMPRLLKGAPVWRSVTHVPGRKCHSCTRTVPIHCLEIVCRDLAAQCAAWERVHGLSVRPPVADLGLARVAKAPDGSVIGVRAPLAEHEQPIMQTYLEVEDIASAVEAAEAAGGVFAYPPTRQGDTGTWAIYFLGDVQIGLWQR
jgi:predicted enzyme related to lactoylglutathione lyase